MLAPLGLIVFWSLVVRLWIIDGPKVPLTFIGLWLAALGALALLGLPPFVFWSFQAGLAAVLLIVERYKSAI